MIFLLLAFLWSLLCVTFVYAIHADKLERIKPWYEPLLVVIWPISLPVYILARRAYRAYHRGKP